MGLSRLGHLSNPPHWHHRVTLHYNIDGTDGTLKESRNTKSEVREIEDLADCGVRLPLSPGEETDDAERINWPWHVTIWKNLTNSYYFVCSGTLVARRHVVTTAQCVNMYTPTMLAIQLGEKNRLIFGAKQQGAEVKEIIVHPDFDQVTLQNDISLIVLEKPVHISNYLRPVCLWDSHSTGQGNVVGKVGWIPSWSAVSSASVYKVTVHKPNGMSIVSQEDCLYNDVDGYYRHHTSEKTLCAAFENEELNCNPDKGGGLFLNWKNSQLGHNTWFLRGVVSNTKETQNHECASPHYAVLMDIAMFVDWLKTHIQSL